LKLSVDKKNLDLNLDLQQLGLACASDIVLIEMLRFCFSAPNLAKEHKRGGLDYKFEASKAYYHPSCQDYRVIQRIGGFYNSFGSTNLMCKESG